MYIYRATIYKLPSPVLGVPSSAGDLVDFETTYKVQAQAISNMVIAETAFVTDKSWSAFKALVASPLTWGDVKYTESATLYELAIATENPI
jgi:hypothetical protein